MATNAKARGKPAAGKVRARTDRREEAARAKAAAVNVARAWAGALAAKLAGLSGAVRGIYEQVSGECNDAETRAAGKLLSHVLDQQRLNEIHVDLHALSEHAAGLLRGDAGAELPDVEAAAIEAGRLLVLAD